MVGQDVSIMFQLWRHNVHNSKGHWSNINLSRQNTKTLFFWVRRSMEKGQKTPRPFPFWQISNWKGDQISLLLFENSNCHIRGICKLWMFPEHFQINIKLAHSTSFWKLTFPSMQIKLPFRCFRHISMLFLWRVSHSLRNEKPVLFDPLPPPQKDPPPSPSQPRVKTKERFPDPHAFYKSPPVPTPGTVRSLGFKSSLQHTCLRAYH